MKTIGAMSLRASVLLLSFVARALLPLFFAALVVSSPALAGDPATLSSATPFRLEVSGSGSPRTIDIGGTNFENNAHSNRDQYNHWQIRRDDGPWQVCAMWNSSPAAICQTAGWLPDLQTLKIGGDYVKREGFIELRVFVTLADETELDPHHALAPTEWSNILRVPVVVPGPAPKIISLSRDTFPVDGNPSDYRFFIEAEGLVGHTVVEFGRNVVISPERVEGGRTIQVSVPEAYRLKTPGAVAVRVRTDKGGYSPEKSIRFVAPTIASRPGAPIPSPGDTGGGFWLTCRGPLNHEVGAASVLFRFAKAPTAANLGGSNLAPGTCAWADRPLNAAEPSMLTVSSAPSGGLSVPEMLACSHETNCAFAIAVTANGSQFVGEAAKVKFYVRNP